LYAFLAGFFFALCFCGWLYYDFPWAKTWFDNFVARVDSLLGLKGGKR
jgi:hypothetical protein